MTQGRGDARGVRQTGRKSGFVFQKAEPDRPGRVDAMSPGSRPLN